MPGVAATVTVRWFLSINKYKRFTIVALTHQQQGCGTEIFVRLPYPSKPSVVVWHALVSSRARFHGS